MQDRSDRQARLEELRKRRAAFRRTGALGWTVGLAGVALWGYGLITEDAMPLIDWPGLAPDWIATMFRNWMCELGLVLSVTGAVPVYYAQFRHWQIDGEVADLDARRMARAKGKVPREPGPTA